MASSTTFKKGEKRPNQGKRGPNKTTLQAKEAIAIAAQAIGGAERLTEWALEDPKNESAFWTSIYPKLLPLTLAGDKNAPIRLEFGWAK